MPGPVRESYNAKGRRSTAGSRKRGKTKKDKTQKNEPQEKDSNADILTPESKEEKETAKKIKLLEEVHSSYLLKCS